MRLKGKSGFIAMLVLGLVGHGILDASGANFQKPLKKKEAAPGSCCTVNFATDDGYPGVVLRQICFTSSHTSLLIQHNPRNSICYHAAHLHLQEDNGRQHQALRVQGAEQCQAGKTVYHTRKQAILVFPAVQKGLRSFSVWEDDETPPASFQNFHWSKLSLDKCYQAQ